MSDGLRDQLQRDWPAIARSVETLVVLSNGTMSRATPQQLDRAQALLGELDVLRDAGGDVSRRVEPGEMLGQGGMGIVRRATQLALGRSVAVKELQDSVKQDRAAALKLLQEAWIAGSLDFPGIAPIHDLGLNAQGQPIVVMQEIRGRPWSDFLADPALVAEVAPDEDPLVWHVGVLIHLCRAVEHAHSRAVLHLDLKPANVMIGPHAEVYLVDWGLAVTLDEDADPRIPRAADQNEVLGTPAYLAPEMLARDGGGLTRQTDLYLLGSCLHELLTGRPPHRGDNLIAILFAAATGQVDLPDEAPAELAELCRGLMAAEPGERPATAGDVRSALQGWLRHRGAAALATEAGRRLEQLRVVVAGEEPDKRRQTYVHYAAARFGFEAALREWPELTDAHEGRDAATELLVRFELAEGDPRQAQAMAAGLRSLDPTLTAAIERAVEAFDRGAERKAELEALERDHDLEIGQRTRAFVVAVMGVGWLATPLALHRWGPGGEATLTLAAAVPAVAFVALFEGLRFWARESMTHTQVNRALAASLRVGLALQVVATMAWQHQGRTVADAWVLTLLHWSLVTGGMAAGLERRLWPVPLIYLAAAGGAASWPAYGWLALPVANAAMLVVVLSAWRPKHLTGEPAWRREP